MVRRLISQLYECAWARVQRSEDLLTQWASSYLESLKIKIHILKPNTKGLIHTLDTHVTDFLIHFSLSVLASYTMAPLDQTYSWEQLWELE